MEKLLLQDLLSIGILEPYSYCQTPDFFEAILGCKWASSFTIYAWGYCYFKFYEVLKCWNCSHIFIHKQFWRPDGGKIGIQIHYLCMKVLLLQISLCIGILEPYSYCQKHAHFEAILRCNGHPYLLYMLGGITTSNFIKHWDFGAILILSSTSNFGGHIEVQWASRFT